jgi:hypothetical protein
MSNSFAGVYSVECVGADGALKWSEECDNAVFDEGEQLILDLALRGASLGSWYMGLLKTSLTPTPAETSTLATLPVSTHEPINATEPGYTRGAIARDSTASGWPTLALSSGDFEATTKVVSFTASGNWTGSIRWLFLTTDSTVQGTTGKLVSLAQLSADRTLLSGDTLNVTYKLKLS